jgi:hypothetical protein
MDSFESASPPTRGPEMVEAVCWECGDRRTCFEYVVCCTGTTFHVCQACEDRVRAEDDAPACPNPASL